MTQFNQSTAGQTDQVARTDYGQMVAYLEDILSRQLVKVRNYDLDGAMSLAEEAHKVAFVVTENRILDRPEFAESRQRVQSIYNELGLTISSERAEVQDKLKQIRQGIKTLTAYGKKK